MKESKILYFKGMHCKSCEMLARHTCEETPGITYKHVSHKSGVLEVDIDNNKAEKNLIKKMEKHGYIQTNQPLTNTWGWKQLSQKEIIQLASTAIIIGIFAFLLAQSGRTNTLMSTLGGTGYITAILTGLVASVSTCLAITGGIVIGFSNYIDNERTPKQHAGVQILFQGGRIGGFFIFGALLGLIGEAISMSLGVTIVLSILVAIIMIYLGGQMTGLLPSLSHWGIHIPSSRSKNLHTHRHPRIAPVIGALTFFIPCGFTQGMQLIALGSGNWLTGGITMALFALGTAPVLFAVGMGSSWIKDHSRGLAKKIIGLVVIAFGIYTFANTWNLVGRGSNIHKEAPSQQSQTTENIDTVAITVAHDGRQIENRDIPIPANTPYKLTINPQSNGIGCMNSMVIPKLGFRKPQRIIKDKAIVFEGNGIKPGSYPIVCASMGMAMGEILVK